MLELKRLWAGYGEEPVLREVDACFPAGKLTAVVGPNGCGKSTLLRAAARLISPSSGQVLLDGQADVPRREYARRVAYLPQARDVPAITVEGLVSHGRFPHLGFPRILSPEDRAAVRAAMERTGAAAFRERELARLSGGERQKAYLAMLLAQQADTLLLDEPTTYLDIRHQLEVLALLRELAAEGRAVAAVLHDLDAALRRADQLLVLDQGRIAAAGTPGEILASGVLRRVFGVEVRRLVQDGRSGFVFDPAEQAE